MVRKSGRGTSQRRGLWKERDRTDVKNARERKKRGEMRMAEWLGNSPVINEVHSTPMNRATSCQHAHKQQQRVVGAMHHIRSVSF